jgi:hypothetical protein
MSIIKNKYFLIFASPICLILDFSLFFILGDNDNFENGSAWILGLICLPPAIASFALSIVGIRKSQRIMIIVPIISILLSVFLLYISYYQFIIAHNANLWGF